MNRTLGEILLQRYEQAPDGLASTLVSANGSQREVRFKELFEKSLAYSERFGPAKGERKIIGVCLYHSLDLHAAFLGGILSGHIPTILCPPSPRMETRKYTDCFRRILAHVKPASFVCDAHVISKLGELSLEDSLGTELIQADTIAETGPAPSLSGVPEETALLQHSSGTTGLQKGVALSHRAILRHNELYAKRLNITPEDVIVSWLPLYHDMGFIACFLLPLLHRIPLVEMAPFAWALRPAMLLEQIHRHRGTLCWLPNFAYSFMAQKIDTTRLPSGLDLSSIRAWINCSEPVYDSSHRSFLEKFGAFGATAKQMTASYAMAENVFAVTQSLPGAARTIRIDRSLYNTQGRIALIDSERGLSFVSNGRPVERTQAAVFDDGFSPLPEGRVGQLAIRGETLFSGYFQHPDLTKEAMTADGWYLTGDMGFILDRRSLCDRAEKGPRDHSRSELQSLRHRRDGRFGRRRPARADCGFWERRGGNRNRAVDHPRRNAERRRPAP